MKRLIKMFLNKEDVQVAVAGRKYTGELLRCDFGCSWIGEEDDETLYTIGGDGQIIKVKTKRK